MIICAHTDCGYKYGWTHKGGEGNVFIDGQAGEFYVIRANPTTVGAVRFHGGNTEMRLIGCPMCKRTFIAEGEIYLDVTEVA